MSGNFIEIIKYLRAWIAMIVEKLQEVLTWVDGKEDEWEEINATEAE